MAATGAYFAEVRHSPAYAASLTRKIFQAADRLETFPQSGRVVPEIGDETLREVVFHNYRIVYLYWKEDNQVEILTVFHASRQFGAPAGEEE